MRDPKTGKIFASVRCNICGGVVTGSIFAHAKMVHNSIVVWVQNN